MKKKPESWRFVFEEQEAVDTTLDIEFFYLPFAQE